MKEVTHNLNLAMGEYFVSSKRSIISCYGLGSCMAIFLYHRESKIGGGIHVMLPEAFKGQAQLPPAYFVGTGIAYLLNAFAARGIAPEQLIANATGGGSLFSQDTGIGKLNSSEVRETLIKYRIFIKSFDVGGKYGRSAKFDTETGMLTTQVIMKKTIPIKPSVLC